MPKIDDEEIDLDDKTIDPLIRAAAMPDPTDEEEKSAPKEKAEKSEKTEDVKDPVDDEDSEAKEKVDPESAEALAKDAEAKDAEDPGPKDPPQTRKEKREERKARFIDSIRKEQAEDTTRERLFERDPYDPLDYNKASEFNVDELAADRNQYGDYKFSEGARLERFYAQQDKFWGEVEYQGKLLELNPKYAFLNEKDPETYAPDRAETVNGLYLELIGYEEKPEFDKKTGRPVIDQNGQQVVSRTVRRTDLPYDKFVERYVADMEDWASEAQANTVKNLAAQKSQTGIRPSGNSHKSGLGSLRPGDISRMSQADFEKHEAEIDRQILSALK